MAVSVAVCEIFSVKEWRDLENQVRGRSTSLKMAPFDRSYATFYWSATGGLPSFRPPPKLDPLGPKTQRRHCCLAPLALVSCFTTFLLIELVKTSDIHLYYCGHLHYYSCNLHYYLGYLYSICISWTIFSGISAIFVIFGLLGLHADNLGNFWFTCNIWAIFQQFALSGKFLLRDAYA